MRNSKVTNVEEFFLEHLALLWQKKEGVEKDFRLAEDPFICKHCNACFLNVAEFKDHVVDSTPDEEDFGRMKKRGK